MTISFWISVYINVTYHVTTLTMVTWCSPNSLTLFTPLGVVRDSCFLYGMLDYYNQMIDYNVLLHMLTDMFANIVSENVSSPGCSDMFLYCVYPRDPGLGVLLLYHVLRHHLLHWRVSIVLYFNPYLIHQRISRYPILRCTSFPSSSSKGKPHPNLHVYFIPSSDP